MVATLAGDDMGSEIEGDFSAHFAAAKSLRASNATFNSLFRGMVPPPFLPLLATF